MEDPLEETCYQRLLSRDFSPNSHNKQHVNLPHVYLLGPASHLVKCGKIVKVISVLIIFLRGRMGSCSRMESLGVARHTLCRFYDNNSLPRLMNYPYCNDFSQGSGQDGGTLPRAIDVIFNSIEDLQTKKYQLKPDKLNGFEIQNEADAAIDR